MARYKDEYSGRVVTWFSPSVGNMSGEIEAPGEFVLKVVVSDPSSQAGRTIKAIIPSVDYAKEIARNLLLWAALKNGEDPFEALKKFRRDA